MKTLPDVNLLSRFYVTLRPGASGQNCKSHGKTVRLGRSIDWRDAGGFPLNCNI